MAPPQRDGGDRPRERPFREIGLGARSQQPLVVLVQRVVQVLMDDRREAKARAVLAHPDRDASLGRLLDERQPRMLDVGKRQGLDVRGVALRGARGA